MQWEYKAIRFIKRSFFFGGYDMKAFQEKLNSLGEAGWELVGFNQPGLAGFGHMIAVLKRPHEQDLPLR